MALTKKERIKRNLEATKKWRSKNRDFYLKQTRERSRIWRLNNPEKVKENNRKHWEKNRENRIEYLKNWRKAHPDKRLERLYEFSKKFKIKHPEKLKQSWKAKSHKRRKMAGYLNRGDIQKVYNDNIFKFGFLTCCLCGQLIESGEDSLEHKIPISRGGTNNIKNLDVAHLSCNFRKRNKTMKEFEKWRADK